ncbi:MAG: hypothetical protein ACOYIK_06155 [Coriobacteriales bacterium]|jgi:hypothetical protein
MSHESHDNDDMAEEHHLSDELPYAGFPKFHTPPFKDNDLATKQGFLPIWDEYESLDEEEESTDDDSKSYRVSRNTGNTNISSLRDSLKVGALIFFVVIGILFIIQLCLWASEASVQNAEQNRFQSEEDYYSYYYSDSGTTLCAKFDIDGLEVATMYVTDYGNGATVDMPGMLQYRKDENFKGWTNTNTGEFISADTDTTTITETTTFEAVYKKVWEVSYIYYSNGDKYELTRQWVEDGERARTPEKTPTIDGYVFDGWDPSGDPVITEDTVITAKWKKI